MSDDEIKETLKNRSGRYGGYGEGIKLRNTILNLINNRCREIHGRQMDQIDLERIWDVVNKLCRLAGDPQHIDTWHDIAGYALLSEEDLKNEQAIRDTNQATKRV